MKHLSELHFTHSFIKHLPADPISGNHTRTVSNASYSFTKPTAVAKPEFLIGSPDAAKLLNLSPDVFHDPQFAAIFAGNEQLEGMRPFSSRYGGHQFGNWAGQLGDGRAITLGEITNAQHEKWEIQLKGAGPTPYSRSADGRAVLRSSLREFLCSEAMFHLGIPTTRALCCIVTGDEVMRDMFYDGNPVYEKGAITTRLAPSFIRFGHFEILAADGNKALLKNLLDYTLYHHFPKHTSFSEKETVNWFSEVCESTARLVVHWMRVGFVHGVMNTDNMSILGLTIDYGPYGWLDVYDPEWTPNTTDYGKKRYRFSFQPAIAHSNLARLASALSLLFDQPDLLQEGLDRYQRVFNQEYMAMMSAKLGLATLTTESDIALIKTLDTALQSTEVDMTLFYRCLIHTHDLSLAESKSSLAIFSVMREVFYAPSPQFKDEHVMLIDWIKDYLTFCQTDSLIQQDIQALMSKANPYFILRNYVVQEALDALANNDTSLMHQLMAALQTPYEENNATRPYFKRRPDWAKTKAGCSALSCSS